MNAPSEELVAEIRRHCGVKRKLAHRLAQYFELRKRGTHPLDAMRELGVSDSTVRRYENWFTFFRDRR